MVYFYFSQNKIIIFKYIYIYIKGLMELNILENGKMENSMEKVFFILLMDKKKRGNGKMGKKKGG
jgi:hypothetical protein